MRERLFFVFGASAVALLAGCTSQDAPQPNATVTVTATPSAAELPSNQAAESSPGPSRGPWGDPLLIVDGRWLVGDEADIPSGGLLFTPSEVYDCAWRVLDADGNVVEQVLTTNSMGAAVTLQDGDLFESNGCNVWQFQKITEGGSSLGVGSGTTKDIGQPILGGSYLVGDSIPPGTYEQRTVEGALGPCEYSVKAGRGGRYFPVESFSTTNLGARSSTNTVIKLDEGDLFETEGCGLWQRYEWVEP